MCCVAKVRAEMLRNKTTITARNVTKTFLAVISRKSLNELALFGGFVVSENLPKLLNAKYFLNFRAKIQPKAPPKHANIYKKRTMRNELSSCRQRYENLPCSAKGFEP